MSSQIDMDFASPNFKLEHREPQDLKDRMAIVTYGELPSTHIYIISY